jgi:DNA-binding MarR family transcriptional regulator
MSRLQREIRQQKPFKSPAHEAVVGLMRTADVVKRRFAEVVEPRGITLPQYNVLRILRGAGPAGLPTLEVGDRLVEHAPGMTRMMDRLEARGWVRRERCPGDRRQVLCRLTPPGKELVDSLDRPMDRAAEDAVAVLGKDEQRELVSLLDRVRAEA